VKLEEIIRLGLEQKATDVHLEPKVPLTLRVNGTLKRAGFVPDAAILNKFAERLFSSDQSETFDRRGSADLCRVIAGVPCRINVLKSDRGTGFAIRLLATASASLKNCNLHPSLSELLTRESGLILLVGPTGGGKSTTLSALIEEINQNETRHIITLESPIEYRIQAKKSLVRQREIGVHTESYEQGLLDSLREDPDVLVVGEMREPEAMRLTLNAAETGHLVIATMHSASAMDAIYRIMMAFPPERQSSVLAQLADTLIGVVSHRMTYRPAEKLLVPCCEILFATHAIRNVIRKGEISKMPSLLQTGGPEGMYTFERYQAWLDQKTDWVQPSPAVLEEFDQTEIADKRQDEQQPETPAPQEQPFVSRRAEVIEHKAQRTSRHLELHTELRTVSKRPKNAGPSVTKVHKDGRIEIPEEDLDLNELIKEFKERGE